MDSAAKESQELAVGEKTKLNLDPSSLEAREAYFSTTLGEGDYLVSFEFYSPKATGNFGAKLDLLDSLGVKADRIGSSYDTAKSQTIKIELMIADEKKIFLRLRTYEDHAPIEGTFSITAVNSGE